MQAATKTRLQEGALALGVPLDEATLVRLERFYALLVRWNARINLTSITGEAEIVERHFLDSLAVAPLLAGRQRLVDVGAGGGFPGAVLAATLPGLRVTAVDSIRKKVAFLEALRIEGLRNLEPVAARLDDLLREGRTFDAAVSRATWEPAEWVLKGAPLVNPGGLLLAMQTADQRPPVAPTGFSEQAAQRYRIEGVERTVRAFVRQP